MTDEDISCKLVTVCSRDGEENWSLNNLRHINSLFKVGLGDSVYGRIKVINYDALEPGSCNVVIQTPQLRERLILSSYAGLQLRLGVEEIFPEQLSVYERESILDVDVLLVH